MAVATITLESTNGDSVVVSAPNEDFLTDDIILDTNPEGLYATGFTVRTQSGAFETGGRIVGEQVPIREMVLPFHITPATRSRFQRLWGTPGNFQKVRWHYDGPSGRRSLTLKLSKEIKYTTENGFDADIDDSYHAVVVALAVNPMFEAAEDSAEWVNPDDRFTLTVKADGGNFLLSFAGQTISNQYTLVTSAAGGTFTLTFGGKTTTAIPWNANAATVQAALEALSSVGAGNVTVTGTAGATFVLSNFRVVFANVSGPLTGSAANLDGVGQRVTITPGIPWNVSPAALQTSLALLSSVGAGKVTVTGTPATATTAGNYLIVFAAGTNGVLTGPGTTSSLTAGGFWGDLGLQYGSATVAYAPNTGWFEVWNPTDQPLWLDWEFDPAEEWQFPDFAFGQERKWGRAVGADAARMIVTPKLTQLLSVMVDPFMDTYVSADLSNAAGLFNGVEPLYMVPPYTASEDDPEVMPVVCRGPAGSKVTLRQRRFWSAESGLEA
ncbi:hypothetical protein [Mycobacterium sp.]|uniref:hypothetical protein n=1 Tax=Mycobacterium sp. TaxID=1785 RepID=UPI0025D73C28|nr:hypothetical protein [Mycobacterium sp.]